jgi:hypothetical protein
MNDYRHGFRECREIERRKRINGFKLAAWCVVALLALLFVVMQLNPMHGETRTTYFVFGPDVRRGTTVTLVDGVPVVTPTPQGVK